MAWLTEPAGEDTASAICAIQHKIKKGVEQRRKNTHDTFPDQRKAT